MTMFKWSKTAGSNSNSDATINWAEGQAPSSVNDSARAMMAAVAKFRDDVSGSLDTAGGPTAYTLTSNQGFTALTSGLTVTAQMNATNGASPTLNVDGLGARALQSAAGTAIPTGALFVGAMQTFMYDATASAWIVQGYFTDTLTTTNSPDLTAIEVLSGTGILRRVGTNSWQFDTVLGNLGITTTADRLVGSNGAGAVGPAAVSAPLAYSSSTLSVGAASSGAFGVVALADASMMKALSAGRVVTADLQDQHPRHPKAWVSYSQSPGPSVLASSNVSSVSNDATGKFTPTLTTAFSSTAYNTIAMTIDNGANAFVINRFNGGTFTASQTQMSTQTGGGTSASLSYEEVQWQGTQP